MYNSGDLTLVIVVYVANYFAVFTLLQVHLYAITDKEFESMKGLCLEY